MSNPSTPRAARPAASRAALAWTLAVAIALAPRARGQAPGDCAVLAGLFLQSGRPAPWPGTDCCGWPDGGGGSIQCLGGRVSSVSLPRAGLGGGLASSGVFDQLTALTFLDLSSNAFSGSIPSLAQLPSLLVLDLRSNELSGELPPVPSALRYLDVSRNKLTGIPDLFNAPMLAFVAVNDNDLQGDVDNLIPNTVATCSVANNPSAYSCAGNYPASCKAGTALPILGERPCNPAWLGPSARLSAPVGGNPAAGLVLAEPATRVPASRTTASAATTTCTSSQRATTLAASTVLSPATAGTLPAGTPTANFTGQRADDQPTLAVGPIIAVVVGAIAVLVTALFAVWLRRKERRDREPAISPAPGNPSLTPYRSFVLGEPTESSLQDPSEASSMLSKGWDSIDVLPWPSQQPRTGPTIGVPPGGATNAARPLYQNPQALPSGGARQAAQRPARKEMDMRPTSPIMEVESPVSSIARVPSTREEFDVSANIPYTGPNPMVAVISFDGEYDDELDLQIGDHVTVKSLFRNGRWGAGVNMRSGEVGMFPLDRLRHPQDPFVLTTFRNPAVPRVVGVPLMPSSTVHSTHLSVHQADPAPSVISVLSAGNAPEGSFHTAQEPPRGRSTRRGSRAVSAKKARPRPTSVGAALRKLLAPDQPGGAASTIGDTSRRDATSMAAASSVYEDAESAAGSAFDASPGVERVYVTN